LSQLSAAVALLLLFALLAIGGAAMIADRLHSRAAAVWAALGTAAFFALLYGGLFVFLSRHLH